MSEFASTDWCGDRCRVVPLHGWDEIASGWDVSNTYDLAPMSRRWRALRHE